MATTGTVALDGVVGRCRLEVVPLGEWRLVPLTAGDKAGDNSVLFITRLPHIGAGTLRLTAEAFTAHVPVLVEEVPLLLQ